MINIPLVIRVFPCGEAFSIVVLLLLYKKYNDDIIEEKTIMYRDYSMEDSKYGR